MRYLPIHIDTHNTQILIIGGGAAAEAKLRTLLKTDAKLLLISQTVSPEISRWIEQGRINWAQRSVETTDFKAAKLIYAATDSDPENARLAKLANRAGKIVNAADQKEACDFITPAIVDRSPVIVSIGTEGTSPSLARAIKTDLETRLPSTLGILAKTISTLRGKVAKAIPSLADRQKFWADIFDGSDLASQLKVSSAHITHRVGAALEGDIEAKRGHVSLVGAGPGNPDLITLAARQKLYSADVIVYDRLVSQGVLDFGRREAEYIYVGKEPGGKSTLQSEINDILIKKVAQNLTIVRLKSGDPLIFGRADEEIEALEAADIAYDIVPGITSAASAAAEIGASLTTRGHNKSISFLTGHDAKGFAEHDWKGLTSKQARAAIYMGVGASRFIQGRLLLHGAASDMPVTVVENASRPNQKIVATNIANLPQDIEINGIKGPAILLLGYSPRHAACIIPKLKEAQL